MILLVLVFVSNFVLTWAIPIVYACACACVASENQALLSPWIAIVCLLGIRSPDMKIVYPQVVSYL